MPDNVEIEVRNRIAVARMNRPARRNALSVEFMRELIAAAHSLEERRDVDAVVLTGGERFFSAGADLKDPDRWNLQERPLVEQREMMATGYRLCRAWEELPQMVVAAIEGYAIGGGMALALAADWRVIGRSAYLCVPEVRLGMPLSWGTIPRIASLVGPARAKRVVTLCERFVGQQALDIGLADRVADDGAVLDAALALAGEVAAMPQGPVRMTKESVNAYCHALSHATGYMAADQVALATMSREGIAARKRAFDDRSHG